MAPATGSSNPKLLTNSTSSNAVTLDTWWTVTFQGDIVVGPGANPTSVVSGEQLVTGTLSAASAATVFPSITAPTGLTSHGSLTSSTTISQDGQYSSINLYGSWDVLTISGGGTRTLYITGDVYLDNYAQICVAAGTSLKLYVHGNITFDHTSEVTSNDADPRDVVVFGLPTCTSVTVQNSAAFHGGIYAPQATAALSSGGKIYGALACKVLNPMEWQSKLYYDDKLQSITIPGSSGSAGSYSVSYWQDN